MINTCGLCGLKDTSGRCIATHQVMPPNTQACVNFDSAPLICHNCNSIFPHKMAIILQESKETYLFCPNCADQIGQCGTCALGNKCDFQTNPSPIPLTIRRQIKQGPMVSVIEEKNPERQKITCQNGCLCYSEEHECMRQFHSCKNYRLSLVKQV